MTLLKDTWILIRNNWTAAALVATYTALAVAFPLFIIILPLIFAHVGSAIMLDNDYQFRFTAPVKAAWALTFLIAILAFAILVATQTYGFELKSTHGWWTAFHFLMGIFTGFGVTTFMANVYLMHHKLEWVVTEESIKPLFMCASLISFGLTFEAILIVILSIYPMCAWVLRYVAGEPPTKKRKAKAKVFTPAAGGI